MDTEYYLNILLYFVEKYSIIGENKTWLRVIAMSNCPFWSSDSHAYKCNSECPFKSLYKDESYEGEAEYTLNK